MFRRSTYRGSQYCLTEKSTAKALFLPVGSKLATVRYFWMAMAIGAGEPGKLSARRLPFPSLDEINFVAERNSWAKRAGRPAR